MKKRNKVFSIIFSTILGIQSMGLPSVFAEMSLDEKEIFSRIESKRHDPKYKNYEKIIDFINCMKYKGKSLDFKLYCLSMLFRLGAKANDINEFITKNGIDLDDTSNPYYIYIIYRSLYYRIEVLPKVGINEELNKNLDKILNNGFALLSDILRNKEKFRKYSDVHKKYIMRSIFHIWKNNFICISKSEIKFLLKGFTGKDFGAGLESLFPYIRVAEINNLTKKRLIEEGIRNFRNIDEFLDNKDRRGLLVEYLKIPEVDCTKKYELACKMIKYYKDIMSVHTDPYNSECLRYVDVIEILDSVSVDHNSYRKELIQELLTCYKKNCGESVQSNPNYQNVVLAYGRIPRDDCKDREKLLLESINYYQSTFGETAQGNPNYQQAILVYGRIPGGDLKKKKKLLLELINYYQLTFGKTVQSKLVYEEAVLGYARIPEIDMENDRNLLEKLIEYYIKNSKNIEDKLKNPLYEEAVLVYGRIPGGDLEYKEKLLGELINHYRSIFGKTIQSNPNYQQAILVYGRIPGGDLENKKKLLEKLIEYYIKNSKNIEDKLKNPLYEEAVLVYGRIPGGDLENRKKLLEELIEYYSKNIEDKLKNPLYEKAVLVYGGIPGDNLEYKEKLLKELTNHYRTIFGKTVQINPNYQQAILVYGRIPGGDLKNKRNLLVELIEHCSKNVEDKLKNPLYEKAVLVYGRIPGDDSEYKKELLEELIDFYKTAPKYDSLANEAMAVYIRIPRGDLKNRIEYLEKLIKAGLGKKYNLLNIIKNIINFEYNLDDSQIIKLEELKKKCYDEESYSFVPGPNYRRRGGYVPSKEPRGSSHGGRGGYVPSKEPRGSSRGGRGGRGRL